MRETLHIRLAEAGAPPDTPLAYALTQQEPPISVLVAHAPLAQILALAPHRHVALYAPAQAVRLTSAVVPAKLAKQAAAAIPYALEDQFAEDVEDLHFALPASAQPGNDWPVAVVAHSQMRSWLAPFTAAGIVPDSLLPETLALPLEAGRNTVLLSAHDAIVRSGPCAGFGCASNDLQDYLALIDGNQPRPLKVLCTQDLALDPTQLNREITLLPGLNHPLEALARHAIAGSGINLLQGVYLSKKPLAREWQVWKLAASLAAAALLLGAVYNGVSAYRMGKAASALDSSNLARFQQLFPAETRIVDLASQTEQQYAALHGQTAASGMLPLMTSLAGAMKAVPSLQLQNLQFRDGALLVSLTGKQLAELDTLRAYFANSGAVKLEVQSANAGEGGVQIRAKIF